MKDEEKKELASKILRKFVEKPELLDKFLASLQSEPKEWVEWEFPEAKDDDDRLPATGKE